MKLPGEEAAALVATGRERAGRLRPGPQRLGRPGALRSGSGAEWEEIAELIETSYRLVAPKTLVRKLDGA